MKLLLLAAVIATCSGHVIPTVPGDNSHYVEGESRYIWMADGDGRPVLVDLHKPVDEDVLFSRNGSTNQYWLFTRQNPTTHQVITLNNIDSLRNSNYRGTRATKVVVHGHSDNGNSRITPLIASAFLAIQDCNVIIVDWRDVANADYITSILAVPSVGQYVGQFLTWLFDNAGGNWNQLHLVGFSLGAHVIGGAGRAAGGRPGRLTGLDPAGPGWHNNANALNKESGVYVEGIHTDGGFAGIMDPVGHADFYPNGGRNRQPGCWTSFCSHQRAPDLFAATVRFNHLIGRRCNNIWEAENMRCTGASLHMGNGIIGKRGTGLYGLLTSNAWPF